MAVWGYDSYEAYRQKNDPDDYISLMVVRAFFENMGLLLKRKFAPITLLDDLLSGPILEIWPKVKPVWDGLRKEHNQPVAGGRPPHQAHIVSSGRSTWRHILVRI